MTKRATDQLENQTFDLLIVGGGINGAGLANLAAYNGLKVALIEKGDFASGTSSKSTKLIHGGLRYLESFEFSLVRESLKERAVLLKKYPHIVNPLDFIIPVYKNNRRPLWQIKIGVFLYDWLSGKYCIKKHTKLSSSDICRSIKGINPKNLIGGVRYTDAQMDDARLCLENILEAKEAGANVYNYVEAKSLILKDGKTIGVNAFDNIGDKELTINAKRIVSCTGPWTNEFAHKEPHPMPDKVRATKGVHFIYEESFGGEAILLPFRHSKRIFFVIPWEDGSLVGTTDTDYKGDLNDVKADQEDIDGLIDELIYNFPDKNITKEKIVTTFAGLRPLVTKEGSPSNVSREHVVETSTTGVVYVYGGKYTTYEKIARDVLKHIMIPFKPLSLNRADYEEDQSGKLDKDTLSFLKGFYGPRFIHVVNLVKDNSDLGEKICDCSPAIRAQVVYAIENEMAQSAEDVYLRRLSLQYHHCPTQNCRKNIELIYSATSP